MMSNKAGSRKIIMALTCLWLCAVLIICNTGFTGSRRVEAAGDIIYFPQPEYSVDEGAGQIVLTVNRTRVAVWNISADYSTSDMTASAGTDYTASSGTISMGIWTAEEFTVPILDDDGYEGDESFTINLEGQYTCHDPENGYYKSCTVTIVDDDEETLSGNNELSMLETDQGSLEPVFDPAVLQYGVFVTDAVDAICLRPYVCDQSASVSINGVACASGAWGGPVSLEPGLNSIQIRVTAQNGDVKDYVVDVHRDILPEVAVSSTGFIPVSGNGLKIGSELLFEAVHTVTVCDISPYGHGWGLGILLEEGIDGSFADWSVPEQGMLEIDMPFQACWGYLKIDRIGFPDGTVDNTDIYVDAGNFPEIEGYLAGGIYGEEAGQAGEYVFEIRHGIYIPSELPEGTVVTASSDGSRFDPSHGDPEQNSMTVTLFDQIQMFSGTYGFEIDYSIDRIL